VLNTKPPPSKQHKTAQNSQKQEGEAAVSLIQSAVEATEHSIPSGTGNNVDVTA
jgi:hypothetical protein